MYKCAQVMLRCAQYAEVCTDRALVALPRFAHGYLDPVSANSSYLTVTCSVSGSRVDYAGSWVLLATCFLHPAQCQHDQVYQSMRQSTDAWTLLRDGWLPFPAEVEFFRPAHRCRATLWGPSVRHRGGDVAESPGVRLPGDSPPVH